MITLNELYTDKPIQERALLVQDVIDNMLYHGESYIREIRALNSRFSKDPNTKVILTKQTENEQSLSLRN